MTTMTIIEDGDDDDDEDEDDRNNNNNYVETNRRLWELKMRDFHRRGCSAVSMTLSGDG